MSLREKLGTEREDYIDLRQVVSKYTKYWYVFVLSLVVCIGLAYGYLYLATPLYKISSSILLKNEEADNNTFSNNQAIGELNFLTTKQRIDNEIEVLRANSLMLRVFQELDKPMVIDADALNCLAGTEWNGGKYLRVLTPHPGEMSRLTNLGIPEIQSTRIESARTFSAARNVIVVLKGERTLIAFPDGRVWINPTGSPAMATGGTGDILTGMIAGLLGQFPEEFGLAVAGAVYLHGLAGEIAARDMTEQPVIATDLLRYLPEGIRGITNVPHPL